MDMYEGFDEAAGQKWIYPNNMPIREYQKTAVEKALLKNMMIVLPTGFGKTFIAAVVMYNFYRWYPLGKLIFVAPTRPLVAQQIIECKKISGIPASDCIEMTGNIHGDKRRVHWKDKRVFFATPQVIENDLEKGILPVDQVRCIVIDEAHRAQGGYAYVNIVAKLNEQNRNRFRVLALSATPGSDIERVKQVMHHLYINDVMFRTEDSIDLAQYRNKKSSRAWLAELKGDHKAFVDQFKKLSDPIFKQLYSAGLTFSGDSIEKVAKYTLLTAMRRLREHEVDLGRGNTRGKLTYLSSAAMSMSQKFELLTLYGIRVFYSSLMKTLNEPRSVLKTALATNVELDIMLNKMKNMFGEDDVEPDINKPGHVKYTTGHPKLFILKSLLLDHFNQHAGGVETRAIVFTKYRESVYDIVQTLKAYGPTLKPSAFVGQGKGADSNSNPGMSQREQIQMLAEFKAGKFNVLVATCVAEEGLDIGEVDLIVCYDTTSSPISNTQRRGRTGRKRTGNVHTLVTKSYEEKRMQKAGSSKRQVESELFNRNTYMSNRYRDNPRMVPDHIDPTFFPVHITPVNDVIEEPKRTRKRKRVREEPEDDDLLAEKSGKAKKANDSCSPLPDDSVPCEWESDWDSD